MEWIRTAVTNIMAISVVIVIAECAVDQSEHTESLQFLCGVAMTVCIVKLVLQAIEALIA